MSKKGPNRDEEKYKRQRDGGFHEIREFTREEKKHEQWRKEYKDLQDLNPEQGPK